ncbi:HEAT repeat domain-containing protein [Stieleria sp. TO1_6]|uniref:HEAT repeat domain-containing protein n=1 Tax=Stieleria tagensis TaxID=2956795 RepID=UPI00209AA8E0|nr:HEAT repeat domain-containing protein [Stieleria tagensis]MCO8125081.1 HEAT repeat domain-containing protein [Stieleria tagensis]
MFHESTTDHRPNHFGRRQIPAFAKGIVALSLFVSAGGCHDGPLYAMKKVNPYFVMKEWKNDRALGVTDHQRREELMSLADQIGSMPAKQQLFWTNHLQRIMDNDPSAEMRRLAVVAAGKCKAPGSMELVEQGLDDENLKVQMEACRALGKRREPEAAQMLASTLGTTTELDVKNAAISALGKHKGTIPVDSLRLVLDEQDPATIDLAMNSLRGVMGKDYGNDPQKWIAAIDQQSIPSDDSLPKPPTDPTEDSGTLRFAEGDGRTIR